jgi:hypothetical protein
MPATIISTSSFASGEIVLLSHTMSIADNGLVTCNMQFACLATERVVQDNLAKFARNNTPPVALPDNVKYAGLQRGTVFLLSETHAIRNGICYIDATYVGAASPIRYTESFSIYPEEFVGTSEALLDLGSNTANVKTQCVVTSKFMQYARTIEYATINTPLRLPSLPGAPPIIKQECGAKIKRSLNTVISGQISLENYRTIGNVNIYQVLTKYGVQVL